VAGSEKLSVDGDLSSDHRIVLLDRAAEETWRRTSSSDVCINCRADDWSEATEWLSRCINSSANKKYFISWAADRLGLNRGDIRTVSTPFRETFAARLIDTAPETHQIPAKLCAEVLGWTASAGLSLQQRWTGLALIIPQQDLPIIVLDARDLFEQALKDADQIAVAGIPIGLRVDRVQWWKFLSSEDWSRSTTRWRMAPVLSGDPPGAPLSDRRGAKTTEWIEKHVPDVLPLLRQAQAAVSSEAKTKAAGENDARSAAEAFLFAVLDHRPLTRNRFRLNVPLDFHFGTRPAEADLAATDVRLVIEIDGYYHFRVPGAYRRDRRKDAALQEHRWFVMRFLAEDVVCDVQNVIEQIEYMLARRDTAQLR
jgi:very-short-patch-repair endonuclease